MRWWCWRFTGGNIPLGGDAGPSRQVALRNCLALCGLTQLAADGILFDREFYSCRMGVAKPALDYFRVIIKELDVSAANVLFLDDHRENVDSAREAGLYAAEFRLDSGSRQLARTLVDFGIDDV